MKVKFIFISILFLISHLTYSQYTCEGFNPVDLENNRKWIPESICMNSLEDYRSEVIDMMANHPGTNEEKYLLFHSKYFFCFLAKGSTITTGAGNCSHIAGDDLLRTSTLDFKDQFLEEYEKMGPVFQDMVRYVNPKDGLNYIEWLRKNYNEKSGATKNYYSGKLSRYSKLVK